MICRLYTIVHCMIWICIAFCYCSMICCSYNHMHPSSHPSVCPSIHPSTHLHLHCSPLHCFMLHCITLHYIALQYLVNFTTSYDITFHDIALHVIWHYPHTHRLCIYVRIYIYMYIYIYIQQRTNRTTISVCGRWLNAAWPGWRKIGRVRSVPRSASPNRVKYWKKYTIAHPPIAWDNGIETCTKLWFAPFDQFVVWLRDWKVWSTYIYIWLYIYGYIYIYI